MHPLRAIGAFILVWSIVFYVFNETSKCDCDACEFANVVLSVLPAIGAFLLAL